MVKIDENYQKKTYSCKYSIIFNIKIIKNAFKCEKLVNNLCKKIFRIKKFKK